MSIYAELRNRIMRKIMKYYENFAFFLNTAQFWRFFAEGKWEIKILLIRIIWCNILYKI